MSDGNFCTYETVNTVNNKFYRGFCSDYRKIERGQYKGSGKYLWNAINKYGWDMFTSSVIQRFVTEAEAYMHEAEIVVLHANNHMSYNLKAGGHGGWSYVNAQNKNTRIMFHEITHKNRRIYLDEIDDYLGNGYMLGRIGSATSGLTAVNIDGDFQFVKPELVDEYLSDGYVLGTGFAPTAGRVHMYHTVTDKLRYVLPEDIKSFEELGYIIDKRSFTGGTIWINIPNTNVSKCIDPDDFDKYEALGYIRGSGKQNNLGKTHIYHDDHASGLLVNGSKIDEYLADGWCIGKKTLTRVWLNRADVGNIYVRESLVQEHIGRGFTVGRVKVKRKSSLSGFTTICNLELRQRKTVKPEKVQSYLDQGWLRGYKELNKLLKLEKQSISNN